MPVKHDQLDQARLTAARIIHSVLEEGAYANLDSLGRLENENLEARDRSFASALVYGTISRIPSIDWLLERVSSRKVAAMDPWTRTVLRLGAWQLYWSHSVPVSAAVDESVKIAGKLAGREARGFVNAVLRSLARRKPELPANRPALYYGLPNELYGYLKSWYGREAPDLAASFLREPEGVVIRVNRLRTTPELLTLELAAEQVEALAGHYSPDALIIRLRGRSVSSLQAYRDGKFMVQSEAAMMAGYLLAPQAGEKIADLCAAPGGKTCHIAELGRDKAKIDAFDIHEERLELVREHARRLGLVGINCRREDATGRHLPDAGYDKVLLDAPCSGLGLLAHKPEIRLHMNHEKITGLYPLQKAMLDNAARLLKPGGILVYSTCTINPAENSEAVRSLVERSAGELVFDSGSDLLPAPVLHDSRLAAQAREGYLQFLPHLDKTDGFFLARLRKAKTITDQIEEGCNGKRL